jgi:hypothetical protein
MKHALLLMWNVVPYLEGMKSVYTCLKTEMVSKTVGPEKDEINGNSNRYVALLLKKTLHDLYRSSHLVLLGLWEIGSYCGRDMWLGRRGKKWWRPMEMVPLEAREGNQVVSLLERLTRMESGRALTLPIYWHIVGRYEALVWYVSQGRRGR